MDLNRNKWLAGTGWVLTGLIALLMGLSAYFKFMHHRAALEEIVQDFGFTEQSLFTIACLQLVCLALYLFPRTAVLGAVLYTGYLGGAVAAHVRVHAEWFGPAFVGVMVWLALYCRDARVRALLPWQSTPTAVTDVATNS